MPEQDSPSNVDQQSWMKGIVIALIICPIFVVILAVIFVAQINQLGSPKAESTDSVNNSSAGETNNAAISAPGIYSSCVACHGDQGQGIKTDATEAPRLTGLSSWYLKEQLIKFKDGSRGAHPDDAQGKQMVPFAKMLSDEDIDKVVVEIENMLPAERADRGTGIAEKGKDKIGICATCHGQKLDGDKIQGGPPISQQHAWYLASAVKQFKAGVRGGDLDSAKAHKMKAMSMMFSTEDELNDVIAAIQSLDESKIGVAKTTANKPAPAITAYSSCVACHGDQGQGLKTDATQAPRLAGQSAWYIKKQLLKFKDGTRGAHPDDAQGKQMVPFAKMLTNEKIDEVIAEIEKLKPTEKADRGTGDAQKGKGHLMICATCHGQQMEGNETQGGPSLKGQHAWYLASAIKHFKAGVRGGTDDTPQSQQMRAMSMVLATEDNINDVVAAIQALDD